MDKNQKYKAIDVRNKISNAITYFMHYDGRYGTITQKALDLWEYLFKLTASIGGRRNAR